MAQKIRLAPRTNVPYQNNMLKGDSCATEHAYQQAQFYYFKAQEQQKISRTEKKEAYDRILLMKKYQHLDGLISNARKLESEGYAVAALKYYNDAIAYARDENLNLVTPTSDVNLELIRQLSEIEMYLTQSQQYENMNEQEKARQAYIAAVTKSSELNSLLKQNNLSPAFSKTINNIQEFMERRGEVVMDYREAYPDHYDSLYLHLSEQLKKYLNHSETVYVPQLTISCSIDSLGFTSSYAQGISIDYLTHKVDTFLMDFRDLSFLIFKNPITEVEEDLSLKQTYLHGFPMPATTQFHFFDMYKNQVVMKATKSNRGIRFSKPYTTFWSIDQEQLIKYQKYAEPHLQKKPNGAHYLKVTHTHFNGEENRQVRFASRKENL